MDSIQGKIDQFKNATQSMWSNALDSDVVKFFVDVGTNLVKIVDHFGLLQTAAFAFFTYLSNKKNSNFDFASILGIHDKEKGWTIGEEGFTGWVKENHGKIKDVPGKIKEVPGKIKDKFTKKSIVEDVVGDPEDIKIDAKEYAEAIKDNINDYVTVDTSEIDTQIDSIQNKLQVARDQLDDAKSKDWDYYKSMGSDAPAQDRDNRIAEKQKEIASLEGQLSELQTKRSETMSDAALKYADIEVNGVKETTKEFQSLFNAASKFSQVKLEMPDMSEEDLAGVMDTINAKTQAGEAELLKYFNTLGSGDEALQAYIASLDGGQASLAGFNKFLTQHNAQVKASGIKAKAAAVGHSILNAAISMGISLIISGAISAITSLVNKYQEWAEAAKDAINAYDEANSKLRNHKKTLDKIDDDYEKLSKGVDNLGKNINLTTEEYERYNEITNDIADMFPHLIAGYTEEGNAILKVKGNVEALKDAYEEEARAARDAVLAEADTIVKSSHNTIKDGWWEDSDGWWKNYGQYMGESLSFGIYQSEASTTELHKLSKYVNGDKDALAGGTEDVSSILQTLKKAGADISWWSIVYGDKDALDRVIAENRDIVDSLTNTVNSEIESAARNNRSIVDAYLGNNKEYNGLDDNVKSVIQQVVQNLDDEFILSFKNNTELFGWLQENLIGQFRDLDGDTRSQITLGFDLATQFNEGTVSIEKYESQVQSIIETIKLLGLENEDEILKSFRVAFNVDEHGKVESAKQNVVKNLLKDEFDGQVVDLTKEDLDIVDKNLKSWAIPDGTLLSWDELTEKIENTKAMAWEAGVEFENVSKGLDSIQDAYSTLSNAVSEYNENGFLTLDSLQSLLSLEPEYLAALQMENGQLSINQTVLQGMVQTRLAEAKAVIIESGIEQLNALAKKTVADATNESATATYNATGILAQYNGVLSDGAKSAIAMAGAQTALNAALAGASANELVTQSDMDAVVSYINNGITMVDELGAGLTTNFGAIMGTDKDKDGTDDSEEDAIQKEWDRLVKQHENKLALLSNERDLIQAEIDQAEAQNKQASAKYYKDLIKNSTDEKNLLIAKQKALEDYLEANKDNVDQDTWTEMNNEINATDVAIKECTTNLLEYYDVLEDLDSHYFEQAMDDVSRLGEEIEFVQGLLEDTDVADENGNWTAEGATRLGLYVNEMERAATSAESYKQQIGDVANSWADYQKLLANAKDVNEDGVIDVEDIPTEELDKLYDSYGRVITSKEEYKEKTDTLTDSMYSEINAYNDAKDGIVALNEARVDAIREGIEKEIEAFSDLTDAKKSELEAERDLYEFRKDTEKQSKNIQDLERRIAALSGSSAASDVAARRKLEQQLMEAKEGLNDTYYDHSRDAQLSALDDENEAYAKSKERYIERLEEQLEDTETLIQNSIMDVLLNADVVYTELNRIADLYGVDLSESLKNPWQQASDRATEWKNDLAESMTSGEYASLIGPGGVVTAFANGVATKLKGPWNEAETAAKNYAGYLTGTELNNKFTNTLTGFGNQIQNIIDKWNGVKKAANDAYAAQTRVPDVGGTDTGDDGNQGSNNKGNDRGETVISGEHVKQLQQILNKCFSAQLTVDGVYGTATKSAVANMQSMLSITPSGKFDQKTKDAMQKWLNQRNVGSWFRQVGFGVPAAMYAKGTTSTARDQWAITDEIGDELVLVPGKDGNLSFMRKGTGVIPADLTANLMEWGQFTPDSMNLGGGVNVNMINNAIVKPQYDFSFDSLVHVDHCDQSTVKDLEKMVDNKINDFSKALNYSIKRFVR